MSLKDQLRLALAQLNSHIQTIMTPEEIKNHPMCCPDCQMYLLSPWQKKQRYHCDYCTREADPEGYRREVMGLNEPVEYEPGDDYGDED